MSAQREAVGWRSALRHGLSIWLLALVVYLALGALAQTIGLDTHRYRGVPALGWPFRVYARGDAGHFLSIARYGYFGPHSDPLAPAFFPGYPWAGRTLARLFSTGSTPLVAYLTALSLIAWAGTATSAVLLWRLAARRLRPAVATASVAALVAGPYSVFLFSSYSEGPFLACALGAWLAAKADRWLLAGALAAAGASIRVSGLFLACGLLVLFWQGRASRRWWELPAVGAPFLVVAGYFAWLHSRTGSWSTWFDVERRGWSRHTVTPWTALGHSVGRLFSLHDPSTWQLTAFRVQDTMELLFAVVFVVATTVLVRRRQWPEATYVGLTAVSLLTSAYYLSVPRNLLVCFPVWLLVGEWLHAGARPRVRAAVVTVSVAAALWNVSTILSDHWSG